MLRAKCVLFIEPLKEATGEKKKEKKKKINEEFLKRQYKRKTDRRAFGAKLVRAALKLFPVSSKLIQPNVHIHPQTHMT